MMATNERRLHLRARSSTRLRAACGAWVGTALMAREKAEVTCRRCRALLLQAELGVEPMLGRRMVVTMYESEPERGVLVDAVAQGLMLRPDDQEKPVLRKWSKIKKAEFVAAMEMNDVDID